MSVPPHDQPGEVRQAAHALTAPGCRSAACQRIQYYLSTLSAKLDPETLRPWTFHRIGSGRAAEQADQDTLHKRFRLVTYGEASQNSFGVLTDVGFSAVGRQQYWRVYR